MSPGTREDWRSVGPAGTRTHNTMTSGDLRAAVTRGQGTASARPYHAQNAVDPVTRPSNLRAIRMVIPGTPRRIGARDDRVKFRDRPCPCGGGGDTTDPTRGSALRLKI